MRRTAGGGKAVGASRFSSPRTRGTEACSFKKLLLLKHGKGRGIRLSRSAVEVRRPSRVRWCSRNGARPYRLAGSATLHVAGRILPSVRTARCCRWHTAYTQLLSFSKKKDAVRSSVNNPGDAGQRQGWERPSLSSLCVSFGAHTARRASRSCGYRLKPLQRTEAHSRRRTAKKTCRQSFGRRRLPEDTRSAQSTITTGGLRCGGRGEEGSWAPPLRRTAAARSCRHEVAHLQLFIPVLWTPLEATGRAGNGDRRRQSCIDAARLRFAGATVQQRRVPPHGTSAIAGVCVAKHAIPFLRVTRGC